MYYKLYRVRCAGFSIQLPTLSVGNCNVEIVIKSEGDSAVLQYTSLSVKLESSCDITSNCASCGQRPIIRTLSPRVHKR